MNRAWFFVAVWLTLSAPPNATAQQLPPRPPDGTYVYRWNQSGSLAGTSTVVVRSEGAAVSLRADTNLTNTTLAGGTLTVAGAQLRMVSYTGYSSAGGLDTAIDLHAVNGAVAGTIKNQSRTTPVKVAPFGAALAVDDGALGTFLMLPAQLGARGARSFQLLSAATGQAGTTDFSVSRSGPYPTGVPSTDTVALIGGSTQIWFNPQTFVVDQIARGTFVAALVSRH